MVMFDPRFQILILKFLEPRILVCFLVIELVGIHVTPGPFPCEACDHFNFTNSFQ